MKRNLLLLALLVFLLSCSKESDEAAPNGSIYKVVIKQQGDFANYNKNLIALTADLQGQGLRFVNKETNNRTDIYLKNEDLAAPKITLVPDILFSNPPILRGKSSPLFELLKTIHKSPNTNKSLDVEPLTVSYPSQSTKTRSCDS